MSKYKYTKGDCYAICEILESLILHKKVVLRSIARDYGYESDYIIHLLTMLADDVDSVIATEQSHRDDTDQMADIMTLTHIEGHEDE